jgi:hypothetical protein
MGRLSRDERLDLLKVEMTLLQDTIDKYDKLIFMNRNWFITIWMGSLGIGFSVGVSLFALLATLVAALYWFIEGVMRYQYWFKYIQRYRSVRLALNEGTPGLDEISVYDLTDHYGSGSVSRWAKVRICFLRLEPTVVYLVLGAASFAVWNLMAAGSLTR